MTKKTDHSKKIGLALSGGGYRAVLYHLGALIRLNEIGYLPNIDRITSVSGGSIVAGRLAAVWDQLTFDDKGICTNFDTLMVQPLRAFCSKTLDVRAGVGGVLWPFGKGVSERIIAAYDKDLMGNKTLPDMPQRPDFIIKSANLATGRLLRFSKSRMRDYLIGEIQNVSGVKISEAVAASSAFPPVFSPLRMKIKKGAWTQMDGAELFQQEGLKTTLELTDAGAYDNLGVERIDHFGTVLVSDAGAAFTLEQGHKLMSPKQVLRVLNMTMDQVRGVRLRMLKGAADRGELKLSFWGIGSQPTKYALPDQLKVSDQVADRLAKTRTRLNRFTPEEQMSLINWGYATCAARMSRHLGSGDLSNATFPYPQQRM